MQNIITVAIDATGNKSEVVRRIIKDNFEGKIFRAVNVKADGEIREYRALLNVSKHVKGVGSTTAHKENLMTIYDMGMASELGAAGIVKQGAPYRSFNLETALMLSFTSGEKTTTYLFTDAATVSAIKDSTIKSGVNAAAKASTMAANVLAKVLG
ncbi:hypothetical protein CPT_Moogle123 [Citrobacter phage Moogle]|uniref:Uncharacterized protein n=2 Tax=Mooglevirus moogle TaxID=1985304 RepID=A0A0A0RP31_9CAUD|nr:hypothetical protein CPT_Moogle123 [Citrobacter phage Moogle]AIW03860.1 hypothetical protein CPT_Moogle123 [Citrobacter phage Moogle]ARB06622.1 hypothetical protein CPT_Mijalis127 [Citrobacter phage Mijalis]EFG4626550.1 hypothetical protein [Escherichia coli]HAU5726783.1 hypothetical protein [Citrobacter freundii]